MKSKQELVQEYLDFERKFLEASNDIVNAIQALSPQNLAKFKREFKRLLPTGIANIFRELNN